MSINRNMAKVSMYTFITETLSTRLSKGRTSSSTSMYLSLLPSAIQCQHYVRACETAPMLTHSKKERNTALMYFHTKLMS